MPAKPMKNVVVQVEDEQVTITLSLSQQFGKSSTGKTTIIASSSGVQRIDTPSGPIHFTLNVFRYANQHGSSPSKEV